MESTKFAGDALKTDLVSSIRSGDMRPGERIPSFRALAARYDVSLNTVQRVISELEKDGMLQSTHGRGTFVSNATKLGAKTKFSVGIFGRVQGHFYGEITECLRNALARREAVPMLYDLEGRLLESVRKARLREMTGSDCAAIVVEGSLGTNPRIGGAYLAEHLHGSAERIRNLIVINRWEDPHRPPGSYYLFDYVDAGYQVARYLYGLGHRRIVLNTYGAPPTPATYEDDIHAGMQSFLTEHPGEVRIECFREPQTGRCEFDQERFRERFSAADRPTAVVVVADYQAAQWLARLGEMGLRAPGDVSVIGFFNTPWAETLPVPLTSVQLNIEKLVLCVVNQILASRHVETPQREDVRVGASIVVRQSCGPARVD